MYFNGGSPSGQYFVGATARRHNSLVQTLLYIRVSVCFLSVSVIISLLSGFKQKKVQSIDIAVLTVTGCNLYGVSKRNLQ